MAYFRAALKLRAHYVFLNSFDDKSIAHGKNFFLLIIKKAS